MQHTANPLTQFNCLQEGTVLDPSDSSFFFGSFRMQGCVAIGLVLVSSLWFPKTELKRNFQGSHTFVCVLSQELQS